MRILQSTDGWSSRHATRGDLIDLAQAQAGRNPLLDAFDEAILYVERDSEDSTGATLRMHQQSDGKWVHAFSAPERHSDLTDGEVDWAFLSGAALRQRLPADVGIKLDPGHRHGCTVRIPTVGGEGDTE